MSKKDRQDWWNSLTLEQQGTYIINRQNRKAEQRKDRPLRELRYNPKYPWITEGVNASNRAAWLTMIFKKNQWLKDEIESEQLDVELYQQERPFGLTPVTEQRG